MCFTYPQLAQVQWERVVKTAEHGGCKPPSRSKHKKQLLPAGADTRGPSRVMDFGTRNVLGFVQVSTSAQIIYTQMCHFGS